MGAREVDLVYCYPPDDSQHHPVSPTLEGVLGYPDHRTHFQMLAHRTSIQPDSTVAHVAQSSAFVSVAGCTAPGFRHSPLALEPKPFTVGAFQRCIIAICRIRMARFAPDLSYSTRVTG